jgi:hypothetical protein
MPKILPVEARGPAPHIAKYESGSLARLADSLKNLISGLGTVKDKTVATTWYFRELSTQEIEAAYRTDWMARKIVDIPADDATREWRSWYADEAQLKAIYKEEEKHGIQQKVAEALSKARLYGGSALVLGVGQGSASSELKPETVGKDGLKFVHVMSRYDITSGDLDRDPLSPYFGEPIKYSINSKTKGVVDIHPSRVIRFIGMRRPQLLTAQDAWGDSVLQVVQDAVKEAGQTISSIATLISEAKVDVLGVPNLTEILSNEEYSQAFQERLQEANVLKSMINALVFDKDESWQRIQANLTGLDALVQMFLLIVSGAADIPATRMLGQSPAGLSATGESDIRNYYDKISSEQEMRIGPALRRLDKILLLSAGIPFNLVEDEEIYYEWDPLWQPTEQERAATDKAQAETWKIDVDAGVIDKEILAEARSNQISESGVYPGWDQIIDGKDLMGPDPVGLQLGMPDPTDPQAVAEWNRQQQAQAAAAANQKQPALSGQQPPRPGQQKDGLVMFRDMAPKPLYVRRPVLNSRDILSWARGQGIPDLLAGSELHVTVVYSRKPVDWFKAGEDCWYGPNADEVKVVVPEGGPRAVECFDGGAIVLQFASSRLSHRHHDILWRCDGSHDSEDYNPHITLSYSDNESIRQEIYNGEITPYRGQIVLGPEIFEEAKGYDPEEEPSSGGSESEPTGVPEVKVQVYQQQDAQQPPVVHVHQHVESKRGPYRIDKNADGSVTVTPLTDGGEQSD